MLLKVAFIAVISAISLLGIGGCTTHSAPAPVTSLRPAPQLPQTHSPAAGPRPELALAAHAARIKTYSPYQLQSEAAANRQRVKDAPTYENRLRLALTLWILGGEDVEIQALAEAAPALAEDEQLRGIGLLLSAIIVERRRNRELQANSVNRTRESRREQEAQQSRLDALQRQIEDLERKLAAMREMEKSLQQRP